MSDDKVKFPSGATSSKGHDAPYQLMTHCAEKRGALRFGAGNVKHENSDTVLANANWLKAFHSRDLAFFRNRYQHARDHMDNEMQGIRDRDPGGNFGAVVWFLDMMCYVEDNDPAFYDAIIGLKPHPGERKGFCPCVRCTANFLAPRGVVWVGTVDPDSKPSMIPAGATVTCQKCHTNYKQGERHGCAEIPNDEGPIDRCRKCNLVFKCSCLCSDCNRCEDCCKCL